MNANTSIRGGEFRLAGGCCLTLIHSEHATERAANGEKYDGNDLEWITPSRAPGDVGRFALNSGIGEVN